MLAPRPGSGNDAGLLPFVVDATRLEIVQPLGGLQGDVARGQALVANRSESGCVLCHGIPGERFAGNLGPSLDGVSARLTPGQLRLRLVDSRWFNPQSLMPSYYRLEGLQRVAPQRQGQPVLTPQQLEDVLAWLLTLR